MVTELYYDFCIFIEANGEEVRAIRGRKSKMRHSCEVGSPTLSRMQGGVVHEFLLLRIGKSREKS
ncbi:hypothetical protein [Nodularia spumigena]|uniref:hypothetical protein n=1 Tax=Nodularia spumigena TaxID=70799 RepID=UPI00232F45FC|nr:hypothetical protein [Nodularia spumigena]